jgi:hypothetical protein
MNYPIDNLTQFIADLSGLDNVQADDDIFSDLGMVGDDFHEMIEKYAATYSVDISDYVWYFHADEEGNGFSFGSLFSAAPYNRVTRIPVTPAMLTDFANKGKWEMEYPDHHLPKMRHDLLINTIIVGLFFIGLLLYFINKWI